MYTLKILKETSDFRLIACDASPYASGFIFGDRHYLLPYAKHKEAFLRCLKDIIVKEKVDYVFPNVDEELVFFAEHNKIERARIIISPLDSVRNTVDKYRFYQVFSEEVYCPETFLLKDFRFKEGEWVIKPRFGRGSQDIFQTDSSDLFDSLIRYLTGTGYDNESLVIQEGLPGREFTVDVLCDVTGNDIVIVPRERLLTSGGISAIGRTQKDQRLIEYTKRVLSKMPFLGPINVQFKEDKKGNPKLMEINPRCSGGTSITFRSGINIPLLAIKMIGGEEIIPQDLEWEETLVFRYYEAQSFNEENIISR